MSRTPTTTHLASPISIRAWYASVPTDGLREAYRSRIMTKQAQNSGILTKSIDCLEMMSEQMLTLQRALERVESNKRGHEIQRPTVRLKVKQF